VVGAGPREAQKEESGDERSGERGQIDRRVAMQPDAADVHAGINVRRGGGGLNRRPA